MRIYNQPPPPQAKTSVITPSKASGKSSSKPSALQERMMKYQQVVAESSEEGIYSSLRSSIDKPTLHIDMKERMAAWGHKDVEEDKAPPEDIIQEEEKEEEVEVEPISIAERMAKYREESSPDKFEKKRAKEEETEKLMKLREEEDKLQKMKEEEERKSNAKKVLSVNPRRASNAIKERMKAWGYNPEEEEVPETKVESVGDDAPPDENENVCDTSEPESPKHTREVSTKLKERMSAFDNKNIVDAVTTVVGEVSEPAAEPTSPTHVKEVSSNLKERMSAFSNTGDGNVEATLPKKPIQISEVAPNILEEKMKAYKRAGSSSRELKPTPPTDLPPRELTSSLLKEKLNVWEHGLPSSELEGGKDQDRIKENELAHIICSNLLKEKMNAYKEAGASSQQTKIASPVDFPSSELTGSLLKERLNAWENGPSIEVEGNNTSTSEEMEDFDEDTVSLLSEAMPVVDEKCKQELQSIMKDDTFNKDERLDNAQ